MKTYIRLSASISLLLGVLLCVTGSNDTRAQESTLAVPGATDLITSDEAEADNDKRAAELARLKSAFNIVFDCSGSMGLRDVPAKSGTDQRRGDVCRKAIETVIENIDNDEVGVGLMLFGHRSYWTKTNEGQFEVLLSRMGQDQRLTIEETDPSFDVKQEVVIAAASENQIEQILNTLAKVEFNRGAQAPCLQAIDSAVEELADLPANVTNRSVIVIADGFNQLANAKAASQDIALQTIRDAVNELNENENEVPVSIHFIMFGKQFEKNDDAEFAATGTKEKIDELSEFAIESGGSLQTAIDSEELIAGLANVVSGMDGKRSGTITGEIQKNNSKVGTNSEFKVTLEGEASSFKPVTTTDGKFTFEKVPLDRKFTIKVSGRIRNRIFSAEKTDVKASSDAKSPPIKVSID